ncbi:MAG TPA: DUF429 domain-containing protein [Kiritimatiellia bacterium]|nr:DUF429 domain-containing protein [Kiritimatiellia bacterium]
MMNVLSLGIDVGVGKGLDLVLLDGELKIKNTKHDIRPEELQRICQEWKPDIVAIDSPPGWSRSGKCRQAELKLRERGIQCFATPSDPARQKSRFYDWMRVGFRAFEAISLCYPRYRTGNVRGHAIEIFPYATSVALAGKRPTGMTKVVWRRSILRGLGVAEGALSNVDQVDAALASITGIYALNGRFEALGEPEEGVLVVPPGLVISIVSTS